MKMHSLFSAVFSNGEHMTGTLGQIYAAQDISACRVTISPYITVAKAPAPIANDNGRTGYALFVPVLPFAGKFQQITSTYQRLTDAVAARNLLDEIDVVEFFAKYLTRKADA